MTARALTMDRRPDDPFHPAALTPAAGFLFCILLMSAAARAQGTDSPVSDPRYASLVLARVGPDTITAREFLLSYDFGPAFVKRRANSRNKHLEFMINEKLLGLDAAARGARTSPRVRRSVAEIEGDLATEELYRDDVLARVRISEPEIEAAMREQRVHFRLRWLYASSSEEIDSLRGDISRGGSFDDLFMSRHADSASMDRATWSTTRFRIRNERPEIAAAVDTLRPGVASQPVEGPDGWYMFSADQFTFDAIVTDADAASQRYDARRALTQRKADSLSTDYTNAMMSSRSPVIDPATFGLVSTSLAQVWVPNERLASWQLGRSLDDETRLAAISNIDRFASRTLVRMNDRKVNLGRFLSWYRARDRVLKLHTTSQYAFESSLEQLVWRMVRDGLLIERAKNRGLQKRESVRTQKEWWEDKVLYETEKSAMADSIPADENSLRAYYRAHIRDYRSPKGDTLSYKDARVEVVNDYRSMQLTARILHRLIALKRIYPVWIDERALESLPVDTEEDPRAVDMYFAKTGGTFPHPAFPTIDYDWERWE